MSTPPKMIHNIDSRNCDDVIGGSISRALSARGSDCACPSLEEIAALVDRALPEERRDLLFGHMACCTACRETYTLSKELSAPQTAPQRKTWYIAASALAMAAVVVLVITLTLRQSDRDNRQVAVNAPEQGAVPPQEVKAPFAVSSPSASSAPQSAALETLPSGAEQAARLLAQGQNPSALLDQAGSIRTKSYGFASGPSPSKAAFHIGVSSLIFEIAMLGRDREAAGMALARIGQYLPAAGGKPQLGSMIDERKELVYQGAPFDRLKGLATQIESSLPAETRAVMRFGVWCEAGRLAAVPGKRDFLNPSAVAYFEQNLPPDQLPPGAGKALKEIATGLNEPQPDLEELGRKLEQIIVAFL